MAQLVFWDQLAQKGLLSPRPLHKCISWYLMSLFDSPYDSDWKEALFVKIGAKVLDL